MRKQTTEEFIYLGIAIRFLMQADAGAEIHVDGGVVTNVNAIVHYLRELEMPVSLEQATNTPKALTELLQEYATLDHDAQLSSKQAEELADRVRALETVIRAEANTKFAYMPTPKRFEVNRLIENVGSFLAPDTFEALPEQVQRDLEEAGKCIAFERPTAVAFHTMRAIEGELRAFYRRWIKRGRASNPMWKGMTDQLRARREPPPAALLDQLDSIRQHFRNPTQHPDAFYDIYEAQELFSGALDVISRMARTSPPRRKK